MFKNKFKIKMGVQMLVYTCKKRFFCPSLKRHIPVGTEMLRFENITKLTIKEFDSKGRATVYHYTSDEEVIWFHGMELNAGFFTPKGKFQESDAGRVIMESGEPTLTLKVLSTNDRNKEGFQIKGAFHFNRDRNRIEVFDGVVWLNEDLIKLKNKSGKDLYEGHPVVVSKNFSNAVTTTDVEKDVNVLGVVVDGNHDGSFLTVAISGEYRVNITGSIQSGDFITSDSDGKAKSNGSNKDGSVFGIALQNGENGLIRAFIFQG